MISLTAQYALRAIMHLARAQRWCTADEVAAVARIPPAYVAKVLRALASAGIVQSQRGLNGGFRFDRDAARITVYDIVHAIDHHDAFGVTVEQTESGADASERLLADIRDGVDRRLRRTAVSELLAAREPVLATMA